jgi:predicted dehydrogenase
MYAFEGGKIAVDGWGGSWIDVHDADGRVKYPPIEGQVQSPAENFVDAILGRAEPRTNVVNGVIQSELIDAIYESARTGKPAGPKPLDRAPGHV